MTHPFWDEREERAGVGVWGTKVLSLWSRPKHTNVGIHACARSHSCVEALGQAAHCPAKAVQEDFVYRIWRLLNIEFLEIKPTNVHLR